MKSINPKDKHARFKTHWHPYQITIVDNMLVPLTKVQGECVGHAHENEVELFHVPEGTLYIQSRDKTQLVNESEIIIAPSFLDDNGTLKPIS